MVAKRCYDVSVSSIRFARFLQATQAWVLVGATAGVPMWASGMVAGCGGAGAMVASVGLLARNRGEGAQTLRVRGIGRGHGSCDGTGWERADAMVVHESAGPVIHAAEQARVPVVFDSVECYDACEEGP